MKDFKAGDSVRFINGSLHESNPLQYPREGSIGKILYIRGEEAVIEWMEETSGNGCWWCDFKNIERT